MLARPAAAVLLLLPTAWAWAQSTNTPPASPPPQTSGTSAKPATGTAGQDEKIDVPIPVGEPVKGIRIPYFKPDGSLQMMFDAEKAKKLDENFIEMENLTIVSYEDDGQQFTVKLPKALFNLQTRMLTGDSQVYIDRGDFQIVGDTLDFNTKTRFGKIIGKVKMIITNVSKFDN